MSHSLVTMSYIVAAILFILSLSGLSNQETARKGNYYGMLGMAIAIIATILSGAVNGETAIELTIFNTTLSGAATVFGILIVAFIIGGSLGAKAAYTVEMTQMPELVAIMHSLVGMAAVLVGYANFMDSSISISGAEKTIHELEIYIGVLIASSAKKSAASRCYCPAAIGLIWAYWLPLSFWVMCF
jgi:NAD(P) transhydrogenase subunit beta